MSKYNRNWHYRQDRVPHMDYGGLRGVCPPRFAPNYAPPTRFNCPPLYGPPPMYHGAYPMPQNYPNNEARLDSPTGAQFSPVSTAGSYNSVTSRLPSPGRQHRGPRTPPGSPPRNVQASERHSITPTKDTTYESSCNYKKHEKRWQHNRNYHTRSPPKQRYKNQQRNAKKSGYSYPSSSCNNSNTEPPSAINSVVQSYLLQMLTTQPPPSVFSATDPIYTPPPLPPTPVRQPTPPPPPSDGENWDTPSETSNDATAPNENISHTEKNNRTGGCWSPSLPTTPIRQPTPPPRLSDEENWDTPSETSNDAAALNENISNNEKNNQNSGQFSAIQFSLFSMPTDEENWDTHLETSCHATALNERISNNKENNETCGELSATQSRLLLLQTDEENWEEPETQEPISVSNQNNEFSSSIAWNNENFYALKSNDGIESEPNLNETNTNSGNNKSFKIKLPFLANRPNNESHNDGEVENTKESINKNEANPMSKEINIDIPNLRDNSNSITNSECNQQSKLNTILKIVTPKNADLNRDNDKKKMHSTKPKTESSRTENDRAKDCLRIKTKSKRKKNTDKSIAQIWSLDLAVQALRVEQDIEREANKENVLILRFPDPPLTREIVKDFCKDIESVHFQHNSAPRYCFVSLKEGCNVVEAIETISKIPFGSGVLKAELRTNLQLKSSFTKPETIDPFTLYVGNLPYNIASKVLKEHFPEANRINIGFAQRMKNTRYAFIQYRKVEDAIAAYRRMARFEIEGRSIVIRFKRMDSPSVLEEDGIDCTDSLSATSNLTMLSETIEDTMLSKSIENTMPSESIEDTTTTMESIQNGLETAAETIADLNSAEGQSGISNMDEVREEQNDANTTDTSVETEVNLSDANLRDTEENLNGTSNTSGVVINSSKSEDLIKSNESVFATQEPETNCLARPVECLTLEFRTQSLIPNASAESENHSHENINDCHSNAVQSLMLEGIQGQADNIASMSIINNVKKENLISSIQNSEKVLYSAPCLTPRGGVNKFESNEDFEFFSDSTSRTTVCTERPPSSIPCNYSVDLLDSCSTSGKSDSSKFFTNNNEETQKDDEIPQDLIKDINKDIALLKESLNKNGKSDSHKCNSSILTSNKEIAQNSLTLKSHYQLSKNSVASHDNDDDLVPSNALLFRRNSRLASNETSSTGSLMTEQWSIKSEFGECDDRPRCLNGNTSKTSNTSKKPNNANDTLISDSLQICSRKRKSPRIIDDLLDIKPTFINSKSTIEKSNAGTDNDDLVPVNCALHLYKKSSQIFDLTLDDDPIIQIKREAETEDLYSLPKRTAKGTRNEKKISNNAIGEQLSDKRNKTIMNAFENHGKNSDLITNVAFEKSNGGAGDDDDDVIIVSSNLTPTSVPLQNLAVSQGLHFPNENDTFQIKKENPLTSIEKSILDKQKRTTHHRDNLDRLFALLNSNSDDEL